MKLLKWGIGLVTAGLFLATVTSVSAEEKPVTVNFDGKAMQFSVAPVIENGVTFVQFRPIFEKLGLDIKWDGETKKVTAKNSVLDLQMVIASPQALVNNVQAQLEAPPKLIDGNTMVPLRFVSEVSGKEVLWNGDTKTVTINSGYEKDTVTNPYGNDSFLKLDDVANHVGVQPKISYKDDTLYATWYKDTSIKLQDKTLTGTQFYVSIAKNGRWIKQAEPFYYITKDTTTKLDILYVDGAYYLKDDFSIKKLTPTDIGSYNLTSVTDSLPHMAGQADSFRPAYIDGKVGFYYTSTVTFNTYSTSYRRLYYESSNSSNTYNNYYDIKDVYKVMDTLPADASIIYDSGSPIMYLLEQSGYRQLDTSVGDLKYSSDGKDSVTPLVKDYRAGTAKLVSSNGKLHVLFMEGATSQNYRYATVGKGMQVSNSIYTGIKAQDLQQNTLTVQGNKLFLWSTYEFSRKPSIQLNSFTKR